MTTDIKKNRQHEQHEVLLLMAAATYRAGAFLSASRKLNLTVVVGIDLPETLSEYWHVPLGLDFLDPETSVRTIVEYARQHPIAAIIAVDDNASEIAARASSKLGLAHNSPQASEAARDKLLMRRLMSAGGAPGPAFRRVLLSDEGALVATQSSCPGGVQPPRLAA